MVDAKDQRVYEQTADAIAETMMNRTQNKPETAAGQATEEEAEVTERRGQGRPALG